MIERGARRKKFRTRQPSGNGKARHKKFKHLTSLNEKRDRERKLKAGRALIPANAARPRRATPRRRKWSNFRISVIARWMHGPLAGKCQCCAAQIELPGLQVDHILDRQRWPEYVFEEWNVFVSCGRHEDITRNQTGAKLADERLLEIVGRLFPDRKERIELAIRNSMRGFRQTRGIV